MVAHLLGSRFARAAQRRWRGGRDRGKLPLFSVPHGRDLTRTLSPEVQRHALEHGGRLANVGRAALVREPELLLRGSLRQQSTRTARSDVRDVQRGLRCVEAGRPAAMGQRRNLHSRNAVVRWTGTPAGRYRGGNARALPAAKTLGATLSAFHPV